MKFGLVTDLQSVVFDEYSNAAKIHAMPANRTFSHPTYGKIEFTNEKLQRFANNVNNNVRGVIPDIDFDHKRFRADAAGWVQSAEAQDDGLWLNVEFTDEAKEAIKSKRYRYFSPELATEWVDPETGQKHQDVLAGGALTNRPFLKRLTPLSLDDGVVGMVFAEDSEFDSQKQKGRDMGFFESVRNALGLAESTSEEDVAKKLAEQLKTQPVTTPPAPVALPEGTPKGLEALVKTFNDRFSELHSKLEEEQRSRRFAEAINQQFDDMKKLLESTDEARRKAEIEAATKSLTEGKKFTLPVPAQTKLRTMLLSDSVSTEDVMKLFGEVLETGLVPLGEKGGTDPAKVDTGSGSTDPVTQYIEKVNKLAEDKKLSDSEAMRQVSLSDPQLYLAYRNATFIEGQVK